MKINIKYMVWGTALTAVFGIGYIYRKQIRGGVRDIVNYVFTAQQEAYLKELHPKYSNVFRKFIAEVEKTTPYKVLITSGFRTFPEQIELHKENSQNASAGKSMHNYGTAVDLNLISKKDGSSIRKADSTATWEKTGIVKIAKKYGLKWGGGGNFGDYADNVHFEIPLGGASLYAKAIKQFGSESKVIGNKVNLT
jgi:hypothetical protein